MPATPATTEESHNTEEQQNIKTHYCPAIAFWPVDKPRPISDMKGVFSFFDFNFR